MTRAALLLLAPIVALAQNAQLSGFVRDPSGAAVPSASIAATNLTTGARYPAESDDTGAYAVAAARPGLYKVAVRKPGFRTAVWMNLRLESGRNTRADFDLQVGSVEEVVFVRDSITALDPDSVEPGAAITRDLIAALPLNGRGVLTLLETSPGTVVTPASSADSGQFSVNGQRADANYLTVDGVGANAGVGMTLYNPSNSTLATAASSRQSLGGALPAFSAIGSLHATVSIEEIDEFRLRTSAAPAAFGRMPGGLISITTRSGTNELHGAASFAFRDSRANARDWFANRDPFGRLPSRLTNPSGSFGGPLRRNRTYFFLALESLRLRMASPARVWTPTADSRAGAGPAALPFLSLLPLPNGLVEGGLGAFEETYHSDSAVDTASLRLDHQLTPGWRLFARYSHSPSSRREFDDSALQRSLIELQSDSVTAGVDGALGARANHTFRINTSRVRERGSLAPPNNSGAVLSGYVPPVTPLAETNIGVFVAGITDAVGWVTSGDSSRAVQRQWNIVESVTAARGRHLFQAGFDFRRLTPSLHATPYELDAQYQSLDNLAHGRMFVLRYSVRHPVSFLLHNWSAYVQDAWRLAPRLTLNLGVRWESNPPPVATSGATLFVSKPPNGYLEARSSRDASTLWRSGYRHFAPRAGLAWKLRSDGSLVLRCGAGYYYDLGFGSALGSSVAGAYSDYGANLPADRMRVDADWSWLKSLPPTQADLWVTFVPDFRSPKTISWNVGLEQSIGRDSVASLSYNGARGRSLIVQILPAVVTDTLLYGITTNLGRSDYHALAANLRSRPLAGWQAVASYTWSHSLDNMSKDGAMSYHFATFNPSHDRGNSDFDIRHSFFAGVTGAPTRLRGWTFASIFRARTGFPINPSVYLYSPDLTQLIRPDRIAGAPLWLSDPHSPGGRRLNPSSYTIPPGTTEADLGALNPRQGTFGRNSIPGFGMWQIDVSLRRQFRLSERAAVEARLDAFNALNHPNFGNPSGNFSVPGGFESTSMLNSFLGAGTPQAGLIPALQVGGPRSMQAALRLQF